MDTANTALQVYDGRDSGVERGVGDVRTNLRTPRFACLTRRPFVHEHTERDCEPHASERARPRRRGGVVMYSRNPKILHSFPSAANSPIHRTTYSNHRAYSTAYYHTGTS